MKKSLVLLFAAVTAAAAIVVARIRYTCSKYYDARDKAPMAAGG